GAACCPGRALGQVMQRGDFPGAAKERPGRRVDRTGRDWIGRHVIGVAHLALPLVAGSRWSGPALCHLMRVSGSAIPLTSQFIAPTALNSARWHRRSGARVNWVGTGAPTLGALAGAVVYRAVLERSSEGCTVRRRPAGPAGRTGRRGRAARR